MSSRRRPGSKTFAGRGARALVVGVAVLGAVVLANRMTMETSPVSIAEPAVADPIDLSLSDSSKPGVTLNTDESAVSIERPASSGGLSERDGGAIGSGQDFEAAADVPPGYEAGGFVEDFDTLSPKRWLVTNWNKSADWQNCNWSTDMVGVEDGQLRLRLMPEAPDSSDLQCGELQTRKRLGYGTYEARMRTDVVSGMNAAFFTYIGKVHKKPHDEIDIELLGVNPHEMSPNAFVSGASQKLELVDLIEPIDTYKVYGWIWSPTSLRFFIDGREVATVPANKKRPTHEQKLMLSIWSTSKLVAWMGPLEPVERTHSLWVDWLAFTPIDAPCQFAQSLACRVERRSVSR